MDKIIRGDVIASKILTSISDEVKLLSRSPKLAVILIGDNFASQTYVNAKQKAGLKVGIDVEVFKFEEDVLEVEVINKINQINNDNKIDGIIVQLPLPKHINEAKVVNTVNYKKDVDGFTYENAGRLFRGSPQLVPCTPLGILHMLKASNIDVVGKNVVVVGRSNLVGLPLAKMLVDANATVTICHSKTANLKEITKHADILLVAIGSAKFINAEYVKKDSIVIDIGINRDQNNKLVGDVDLDAVIDKVKHITPVPKGVGPMTIAMLLLNTLKAHKGEFNNGI